MVAFGVGEVAGADFVPWYIGKEERIGEEEVGVGDFAEEIVADAEGEVEAVEAVLGEHGEILGPHVAVVEPGLVFELAAEEAHVAADGKIGQFGLRFGPIGAMADAVGHFEDGVFEAGGVAAVEVEGGDFDRRAFDAVGAGGGDDGELGWFGGSGNGAEPAPLWRGPGAAPITMRMLGRGPWVRRGPSAALSCSMAQATEGSAVRGSVESTRSSTEQSSAAEEGGDSERGRG